MDKLKAYIVIGGMILLSILCIQNISGLQFGYKLENFFGKEDLQFQFYKNYKNQFGSDNNFLMIGIESKDGIFDQSFLEEVDVISKRVEEIDKVDRLFSPTNIRRKIKIPYLGVRSEPLLDFSSQSELLKSSQLESRSNNIYSNLFSKDETAIILYLVIADTLSKKEKGALLASVKKETSYQNNESSQIASVHFAGQVNTQMYYIDVLEKEVVLFALITLILLVLFIAITFRSLFAILSSLFILILAVVFTLTLIKWQLGELDFLMTMLPTLLFVIGVSNTIHLLATYRDEFQKENDKNKAIVSTLKTTGIATLVSSVTTAIGFFALYFLPIVPLQNFGIYSGIGILITWGTTIVLLPALLIVTKRFALKQKKGRNWQEFLGRSLELFLNKKRIITGSLVSLLIIAVIGITFIKSNSYFLDDLNDNSSLKKELLFFEQKFGGIRPFELAVTIKDPTKNLLDITAMNELEEIEDYLVNSYGVGMLLSVNSIFKETNYFLHSGNSKFYRVPESEDELADLTKCIDKLRIIDKSGFIVDSTITSARFTGKMDDIGSASMKMKNEDLLSFLESYNSTFNFEITGAAHLMDKTNENVSLHLLKGLSFSLLLVTLIIAILFKSIKLALFSLIPNFVPLLLIAGLIGWLGIDLKISTALIFTVIFGIAVDDTIHFLIHYKHALKRNVQGALMNTYKNVGEKLILTTFILSSGFLAFTLSEFNSTFFAGFLITLGLLFALLSDLIILPILITYIENKKSKSYQKSNL
mgnify:CR=1 FL=1